MDARAIYVVEYEGYYGSDEHDYFTTREQAIDEAVNELLGMYSKEDLADRMFYDEEKVDAVIILNDENFAKEVRQQLFENNYIDDTVWITEVTLRGAIN